MHQYVRLLAPQHLLRFTTEVRRSSTEDIAVTAVLNTWRWMRREGSPSNISDTLVTGMAEDAVCAGPSVDLSPPTHPPPELLASVAPELWAGLDLPTQQCRRAWW